MSKFTNAISQCEDKGVYKNKDLNVTFREDEMQANDVDGRTRRDRSFGPDGPGLVGSKAEVC